MNKAARVFAGCAALSAALLTGTAYAEWQGQAAFGIGYTVVDQTGNQAVAPESYDLYEDPGFSISDVLIRSSHHYVLTAELENLNLENRSIRASLRRPGRMSLEGRYRKSRRVYDFVGAQRTYRTASGIDAVLIPHRAVKVMGGFAHTGREGSIVSTIDPFDNFGGTGSTNLPVTLTDYSVNTYYAGTQIRHRHSMVDIRYRQSDYADDLNGELDRSAKHIRVQVFTPIPQHDEITVNAGFSTGWNRVDARDDKRKENVGWGAVAWQIKPDWTARYKLLFSRTDNEADGLETDNAVSTFFLTKRFLQRAQISAGYGFRSQDDLVGRTETNALVFKGSVRPYHSILVRGQTAWSWKKDDNGTRLVGDEDITRHRWEIQYTHPAAHMLTVRYHDRRRDFADLGSETDSRTIATTLSINLPQWGRVIGTYSYSNGEYENSTSEFDYEQHLISARATTIQYRHVQLTAGLTYLRSRLGSDIEKILFSLGAEVDLTHGYQFNVRYNAQNYDDFTFTNRYYTANVIEMNIQKLLNF